MAVDLGLIGLIAFLAIFLLAFWIATFTLKYFSASDDLQLRGVSAGLVAGLTALLVHGLVDNTNWATRPAFVSWLVLGLIVVSYRLAKFHSRSDDA